MAGSALFTAMGRAALGLYASSAPIHLARSYSLARAAGQSKLDIAKSFTKSGIKTGLIMSGGGQAGIGLGNAAVAIAKPLAKFAVRHGAPRAIASSAAMAVPQTAALLLGAHLGATAIMHAGDVAGRVARAAARRTKSQGLKAGVSGIGHDVGLHVLHDIQRGVRGTQRTGRAIASAGQTVGRGVAAAPGATKHYADAMVQYTSKSGQRLMRWNMWYNGRRGMGQPANASAASPTSASMASRNQALASLGSLGRNNGNT